MIFEIITVVAAGLCLGSFATALAWRIPRDIPWTKQRSCCPHCHKALSAVDLVPVFSWLFLKGKCRHCGHPVGKRYLLIECATLAMCLGFYFAAGWSPALFILLALTPFLTALLFIDCAHYILPNQLVLAVGILAVVRLLWQGLQAGFSTAYMEHAFSCIAGGIIFPLLAWAAGFAVQKWRRRDALGGGDVKFFGAAGLWTGIGGLPFYMVSSGVIGIVWGLLHKHYTKQEVFPFGPALILALYASIIFQLYPLPA